MVEADGGDGPDNYYAGSGGRVYIYARDWAENRAAVHVGGGYGGEGGSGGSLQITAGSGPAVNTGAFAAPAGSCNDTDDDGPSGGYFGLAGVEVDNSGNISVPGGNAGSTTGYGGEGGSVDLSSFRGFSVNSGTIDIASGTGPDGNNGPGVVLIDGVNVTEQFLP
jgi:hypothetical protein